MIDQLISWAALLISDVALILSIRVHRRQSVLVEKQIAEHEREAKQRVQAALSVSLVRGASLPGRAPLENIVIGKDGPAEARDVNLTFLNVPSPVPDAELAAKLPVPVLQPKGHVRLLAGIPKNCHPPFSVLLTWRDGTGDRSQEATLT